MWDHRKAKAPGESPGPCICALSRGSVARARAPAPAELVVHAGAEDVVIELDVARCDICITEGRTVERGVVVELDIEIFAFDRPAVTERVFDAGTHGPAAAGIALLMAVRRARAGRIDEKF